MIFDAKSDRSTKNESMYEPLFVTCDVIFREEGKHLQYTECIVPNGREAGVMYPIQTLNICVLPVTCIV